MRLSLENVMQRLCSTRWRRFLQMLRTPVVLEVKGVRDSQCVIQDNSAAPVPPSPVVSAGPLQTEDLCHMEPPSCASLLSLI